jgi:hypothetical protein
MAQPLFLTKSCGDLLQLKSVNFNCKSTDHFRTHRSTLY